VRGTLIVVLLLVGFFVVSPYNFIDPTFRNGVTHALQKAVGLGEQELRYDPDSEIVFESGAGSMIGATVHFAGEFANFRAAGPIYAVLAVIGLLAAVWTRKTRAAALIVGGVLLTFTVAIALLAPYHFSPRHGNAIYPLMCVFVWPGVLALQRLARVPGGQHGRVGALVLGAAVLLSLVQDVRANRLLTAPDTRVLAHRWACRELPSTARILLDNYGPVLYPSNRALDRIKARIAEFDLGKDAFSRYEDTRINLLRRYPHEHGFDVEELGHPWWSPRELSLEELRTDPVHLDMGSPLVDRVPKSVAQYAAEGYDYIITNSGARGRYYNNGEPARDRFPTWVRFYEDLERRPCFKTFDPAEWGGKGPVVRVYRLERTDR